MVNAAQSRTAARDAVVRPLTRAADRPCARPGCPAPARATLTFRYASREAWIARLADDPSPQAYDLCATHASRTRPPHGWQLRDRRPEEDRVPDVPPTTPADLGSDRTVAVLAAALRAVPPAVPARGDGDGAAEVGPGTVDGEAEVATAAEDGASPVLGPDRAPPGADRPRGPRPVLAARQASGTVEGAPADREPRGSRGAAGGTPPEDGRAATW